MVPPAATIFPSAWMAKAFADSSLPAVKWVVTLPSPPNEVSSFPSELYRARANVSLERWEFPAATIFPLAWMATAWAPSSLPAAKWVVTLPSPPKEVSSFPSALYRARANFWWETEESPAVTIFPSAWMATARAMSLLSAAKWVVTLPSPPNEVSSFPSELYRARANLSLERWEFPAATIFPLAWMATAWAPSSLPAAKWVVTLPSPPKEVSSFPSALYRARANFWWETEE